MNSTHSSLPDAPSGNVVESVESGVSLLDTLLMLLTPEQQQHFLASAGLEGVVYANRAPSFDKPLAIKITKSAFRGLLSMLGNPAQEVAAGQWDCDYDNHEPVAALKAELEGGVRFSPPPLDWFKKHPEESDVPIRVESQRFGIPCKFCRDQYRGGGYLLATFLGAPDTRRGAEPEVEPPGPDAEALPDPIDVDHLSATLEESVVVLSPPPREFAPHVQTTWQVIGPNSREAPDIDVAALERLVFQVAANRRYNALSRNTRERCEMLEGLLRLKQFACQYPFTMEGSSESSFELRVLGPPEALRVYPGSYATFFMGFGA